MEVENINSWKRTGVDLVPESEKPSCDAVTRLSSVKASMKWMREGGEKEIREKKNKTKRKSRFTFDVEWIGLLCGG